MKRRPRKHHLLESTIIISSSDDESSLESPSKLPISKRVRAAKKVKYQLESDFSTDLNDHSLFTSPPASNRSKAAKEKKIPLVTLLPTQRITRARLKQCVQAGVSRKSEYYVTLDDKKSVPARKPSVSSETATVQKSQQRITKPGVSKKGKEHNLIRKTEENVSEVKLTGKLVNSKVQDSESEISLQVNHTEEPVNSKAQTSRTENSLQVKPTENPINSNVQASESENSLEAKHTKEPANLKIQTSRNENSLEVKLTEDSVNSKSQTPRIGNSLEVKLIEESVNSKAQISRKENASEVQIEQKPTEVKSSDNIIKTKEVPLTSVTRKLDEVEFVTEIRPKSNENGKICKVDPPDSGICQEFESSAGSSVYETPTGKDEKIILQTFESTYIIRHAGYESDTRSSCLNYSMSFSSAESSMDEPRLQPRDNYNITLLDDYDPDGLSHRSGKSHSKWAGLVESIQEQAYLCRPDLLRQISKYTKISGDCIFPGVNCKKKLFPNVLNRHCIQKLTKGLTGD